MKQCLLQLVTCIIILGACFYIYLQIKPHIPAKNPDPNHTHADFAVWIAGKQVDFSDPKYMSTEKSEATLPDGALGKYLHLHDGNGHVMHRHKPGLSVGDFFAALPTGGFAYLNNQFRITDSAGTNQMYEVRLFVSGSENSLGGAYVFQDDDHLLITDATDAQEIAKEMGKITDDACKYSKTCPWKGPPPTESCIADPAVPCKIVP